MNPEHLPQMATVREGVMKKEILDADYKGEVINHDVAKYVPGIYSLKFFFNDGYVTEDGEEMSVREIRKICLLYTSRCV